MDDHPDLWRRIATCTDATGALAFVREFGLLFAVKKATEFDQVEHVLGTARFMHQIGQLIDDMLYVKAAALWNGRAWPILVNLTARLVETKRPGTFLFKPVPVTLHAALLLQAGEAIAHNQKWVRCRNDGCLNSFRIGDGAHTARREFCSDRCRVAWARHHKQKRAITA